MRIPGGKTRHVLGLGLLLAVLLLSGPAAAGEEGLTRLQARGDRGSLAVLELQGAPLRTMTPVPFRLLLQDEAGQPLTGANLSCDLTMPAMPMPANRPAVSAAAEGYAGEAIFTMAGAWRASFAASWPEGRQESFVFDIEQVLLK
ncbi:hypothetical protein DESUT3_04860 [Desulfuromonas versatilis]|uniref:YtkA-like domain-containing protein n=1 Tax=Desulfuromonas versatilis TaxID=2802975 RepID=A0ABN6DTD6_9BACT|nr:FixH family protein [Desulfuromonas versatilis]BCR03417.1 hypothetical protein DESUT3_04860 [Desulfuromonas versatilis]